MVLSSLPAFSPSPASREREGPAEGGRVRETRFERRVMTIGGACMCNRRETNGILGSLTLPRPSGAGPSLSRSRERGRGGKQ